MVDNEGQMTFCADMRKNKGMGEAEKRPHTLLQAWLKTPNFTYFTYDKKKQRQHPLLTGGQG